MVNGDRFDKALILNTFNNVIVHDVVQSWCNLVCEKEKGTANVNRSRVNRASGRFGRVSRSPPPPVATDDDCQETVDGFIRYTSHNIISISINVNIDIDIGVSIIHTFLFPLFLSSYFIQLLVVFLILHIFNFDLILLLFDRSLNECKEEILAQSSLLLNNKNCNGKNDENKTKDRNNYVNTTKNKRNQQSNDNDSDSESENENESENDNGNDNRSESASNVVICDSGVTTMSQYVSFEQRLNNLSIKLETAFTGLAKQKNISQTQVRLLKDKKFRYEDATHSKIDDLTQKKSTLDDQLSHCKIRIRELEKQLKNERKSKTSLIKKIENIDYSIQEIQDKMQEKLSKFNKEIKNESKKLSKCQEWISETNLNCQYSLEQETRISLIKLEGMAKKKYSSLIQNWNKWDTENTSQFLKYSILKQFDNKDRNRENYLQCIEKHKNCLIGKDLVSLNDTTLKVFGIHNENDRCEIIMFVKKAIYDDDDDDDSDSESQSENDFEDDSDIECLGDNLDSNDNSNINNSNSNDNNNNSKKNKSKNKNGQYRKDIMGNGFTCVICVSGRVNMMYDKCGHICLCEKCYNTWSSEKNFCPQCKIGNNKARKVYISGFGM